MSKHTKRIEELVVIGGGASGLMSAIMAARNHCSVLVLEHMEQAGKKILVTGNGKCNLSNTKQGCEYYRGADPAFVLPALTKFDVNKTIDFFTSIGLYLREKNGGYYPCSEEASAVREALLKECERCGVRIAYEVGIRSIQKEGEIFLIETKEKTIFAKKCILATGGYAAKKTGSDGSGFLYLKKLGQPVRPCFPALVALKIKEPLLCEAAGVRIRATACLYDGKECLAVEKGELQITDYGISGILIFQLSRFVNALLSEGKTPRIVLDFLPELSLAEVEERVEHLLKFGEAKEALKGLLPAKLSAVIAKSKNIHSAKELAFLIKSYEVTPIGSLGFDKAQVTAGGVDTAFVDAKTMESKVVLGLYFCGEILDIDGMCGGYNLQWAFSSGAVAGKSAAEKVKNKR